MHVCNRPSLATAGLVLVSVLALAYGNDPEELPSTSSGPPITRDRYLLTVQGALIRLTMDGDDDEASIPDIIREVDREEYEAELQRMSRVASWTYTRHGVMTISSFEFSQNPRSTSTVIRQTSDMVGRNDTSCTLNSNMSDEALIEAADRAIAEMNEEADREGLDDTLSLNTSWDFRRNPQRQSAEDLSEFYRRLRDTPPMVSTISSGSFHSGLSPIPSSWGSQFTVEAEPIPPLIDPERYARESVWALERVRVVASEVMNTTTQALGAGDLLLTIAPSALEEVTNSLRDALLTTATRMEEARQHNTPAVVPLSTTQPRTVACPICMDNLPTVALRMCGHTLCRPCANRVQTCPTCRELIVGTGHCSVVGCLPALWTDPYTEQCLTWALLHVVRVFRNHTQAQ